MSRQEMFNIQMSTRLNIITGLWAIWYLPLSLLNDKLLYKSCKMSAGSQESTVATVSLGTLRPVLHYSNILF